MFMEPRAYLFTRGCGVPANFSGPVCSAATDSKKWGAEIGEGTLRAAEFAPVL